MKLMRHIIVCFSLLACMLFLAGCASENDPYKGMTEAQIYYGAQKDLKDGKYAKAVSGFEAQEAKYPYGPYAHQEQLTIMYAYYQDEDYTSAQAAAERYIHLYPQSKYIDYAYYMKAVSTFAAERSFLENYFPVDPALRDLSPSKQAFDDFKYVVVNYPNSPYAADARLHMVYIRNAIARNNMAAADYYYTRHAYAAALNRARDVVFHYQGSPLMSKALVMMYRCYQKLELNKNAAATLSVIKVNYPDVYNKLVD